MNTMKTLMCAVALFGATTAFGQTADASALAKARTAQLTAELGLDAQQAAKLQDVLVAAETQVAPERAKCAELQSTINEKMKQSYTQLAGVLTPEQMSKLKSMPAGSCESASHGAKAATGCAKEGAKAGCCAGKADAHGAAPAKAAEPIKTTLSR